MGGAVQAADRDGQVLIIAARVAYGVGDSTFFAGVREREHERVRPLRQREEDREQAHAADKALPPDECSRHRPTSNSSDSRASYVGPFAGLLARPGGIP